METGRVELPSESELTKNLYRLFLPANRKKLVLGIVRLFLPSVETS